MDLNSSVSHADDDIELASGKLKVGANPLKAEAPQKVHVIQKPTMLILFVSAFFASMAILIVVTREHTAYLESQK